MGLFPRSSKRRVVKKWFKRTGLISCDLLCKKNGLYWYRVSLPHTIKFIEKEIEDAYINGRSSNLVFNRVSPDWKIILPSPLVEL
jgi:hypothetical protein